METLKKYWDKLVEKWNSLSKENKRLVIILGALAVVIIITSVYLLTKPTYVALVDDNVDSETLSSIVTVLDENGLRYKLTTDGSNILVNQKDMAKAKIAVSGSELPTSRFTWKNAIGQSTLGMTDKEKKNIVLLASQDTLATELESIDGIKSAKVNLTLPDDDVFAIKGKSNAQAGVVLTLGRALSKQQIQAVVNHIRMSVEGLKEENISVIDSNANSLFPFNGSSITGSATAYDEIREARKDLVEQEVIEQLEPLYDDIRVTVNLQMGFDKYIETNEEKTSPLGEDAKVGLIQEQHLATEDGSSTSVGGEPGYGSNDEDVSYQLQDSGQNTSSSATESDTIYALNTKTSQLEKEIGTVDLAASSISIIVYQTKKYDYEALDKAKTFKDISWDDYKDQVRSESNKIEIPEELIENIKSATGINSITINGYIRPKFIEKSRVGTSAWLNYIPLLVLLGIVGFVAFILIKKSGEVQVTETEPELSVESLLQATKPKENDLPQITEQTSDTYVRISEFVDEKPELVAQLLRNWFNED